MKEVTYLEQIHLDGIALTQRWLLEAKLAKTQQTIEMYERIHAHAVEQYKQMLLGNAWATREDEEELKCGDFFF